MIDIGEFIEKKYHKKITGYSIGFCAPDQVGSVKDFIREHWREDHPVVRDPALMDWQYLDPKTGEYNIVLAKCEETDEIHGIYAFIPVSQFDVELPHYQDVWLSIWKVSPKAKTPLLGFSLLSYMIDMKNPRSVIGIKSSDLARSIFGNGAGFRTGFMDHHYMVNMNKKDLNLIGDFDGRYCSDRSGEKTKEVEEMEMSDLYSSDVKKLFEVGVVPEKSANYIKNRFIDHSSFDYRILKIIDDGIIVGLIVIRIQGHKGSNAIRIVDFFGDEKNLIGIDFQDLLDKYDSEYIDFYNVGISDEVLSKAGFLRRDNDSKVVVPNYFDPFERRNINIDYLFKSKSEVRIFKADSDQDRPNIIA